ncbi:cytidine deaminase [bacterium]|nr:cytidine deaminase [bacterium]
MKQKARDVSKKSYNCYSKFSAGAAVLDDKNKIYSACIIENASFGLTSCAERNAIYKMISEGSENLKAMVVYTPTSKPITPCGACLQVIHEFNPETPVYCFCDSHEIADNTLSDLLPHAFGLKRKGENENEIQRG